MELVMEYLPKKLQVKFFRIENLFSTIISNTTPVYEEWILSIQKWLNLISQKTWRIGLLEV